MRSRFLFVLPLLIAACAADDAHEARVLLDPDVVDLGKVYPTRGSELKVVVADLDGFGPTPSLERIDVLGDGSNWVTVESVVPLPASLEAPVPLAIEVQVPEDALQAGYNVEFEASGGAGDTSFTLLGKIRFDVLGCDLDGDGDRNTQCGGGDCDDLDPTVGSNAIEACNGVDDDCNGLVDDARDADGDGWTVCDDCNEADPLVNPGRVERCNGIDDDCDGRLDASEIDQDGDGIALCAGDCDETDPRVFPGATERCNGIDDDCDGLLDDAEDGDGDRFTVCEDCNDADRFTYPGAPEQCDGLDNDCDGEPGRSEVDADGDGSRLCDLDCDDDDPNVFPGNGEACDGVDQDCDGEIDEDMACPCDRVVRGGSVYLFCDTDETWADAQRSCATWNYHLLTIDSGAEDRFALTEARAVDSSARWWMGFNDIRLEGRWVWEDGSRVTYTNWGGGEPNDSGPGEDCGQLNRYTDGTWNDEPCTETLPFICELD